MKKILSNGSFLNKFVVPNRKTLDYMFNLKTFNISEGPIRAAKTTDNIVAFCGEIDKSTDMIYLAIAPTQSSAKTILFDGEGLGIKHYPDWQERTEIINNKKVKFRQRIFEGKYEGSDALIILPKKGSGHPIKYIVAFGGNKANSHEPYKGWSVGMVIATQWELLHMETRNELIKRTALSGHRYHFIDLNPVDEKHDVYRQMDVWEKTGRLNYIKKLMQDNPIMTRERMDEIISEYDPESVIFKRDILGERVSAEGLIYHVRDYNILKASAFNPDLYASYVVVGDPGENTSATAYIVLGITKGYRYVDVIKDYRHRNADVSGLAIKSPNDYVVDFLEFIKSARDKMKKNAKRVYIDEDITFIREYQRLQYQHGIGDVGDKAIKEEINTRIKTGINLLWLGRLRFYDNCQDTITSFRKAQYDPKEWAKGVLARWDDPTKGTMIDNIDAVEYGVSSYKYELSLYKER